MNVDDAWWGTINGSLLINIKHTHTHTQHIKMWSHNVVCKSPMLKAKYLNY